MILGQLQMVRLSRTALSYDEVKGAQGANKVRSTALMLRGKTMGDEGGV